MSDLTDITSTYSEAEQEKRKYIVNNEKEPFVLSLCLLEECPPIVRCHDQLFQFNGRCYDLLTDDKLLQTFQNFIREFAIVKSWKLRGDVLASFKVLREIATINAFNDYDNLMCLENGILDLTTRSLRPHDKSTYFDSYIHVSYDPSNKSSCPVFMNYLNDVFNGDEDTIANIIRLGGYLLDTSCKAGKMFLLNGAGGSGKSTLINIFSMFFHRSSDNTNQITAMSLEELASGSFDKEDLINSRVNLAAETKKGYVDSEEIKKIVTGDLIKVSRKHSRAITFIPKTKIVVACNGLPKFTDTSDGIYRRLMVVEFPNQYRTQEEMTIYKLNPNVGYKLVDHELMDKLTSEKNAIFNLFLEGLSMLRTNKYQFILTDAFANSIQDMRRDADAVREFLEGFYEFDPELESASTDIYSAFRIWYKDNVAETSFKLRSAEIGKRIKEVFGISAHRRGMGSTGFERPAMYHIKKISYAKDDGFQTALDLLNQQPPPQEHNEY